MRIRRAGALGALVGLAALAGCKRPATPWQVVAINKSDHTCEVSMDVGPGDGVNAPDLAAGETRVLLAGSAPLTGRTGKGVGKRKQQVFSPRVDVPTGRKFVLSIDAAGAASSAVNEL